MKKIPFQIYENGVPKAWRNYQLVPRQAIADAIEDLLIVGQDETALEPIREDIWVNPENREGVVELVSGSDFPEAAFTATLSGGLPFLGARHRIYPDHPNRRWVRANIDIDVEFTAGDILRKRDNSKFAKKLALANSAMQLPPGMIGEVMKFQDPSFKGGPWPKSTFSGPKEVMEKARGRGRRKTRRSKSTRRATQKRRR